METRSIKELLILLRDNARVKKSWFRLRQRINLGLCREAIFLCRERVITLEETFLIREFIGDNMPRYKQDPTYGWKPSLWKPRKKWLNRQIKALSIIMLLMLPSFAFSQPPLLVGKPKVMLVATYPLITPSDSCVAPDATFLFRDGVCYAQIVPFPVEQHSDKLSYLKECCQQMDSTTFKLDYKLYVTIRESSYYITNVSPKNHKP